MIVVEHLAERLAEHLDEYLVEYLAEYLLEHSNEHLAEHLAECLVEHLAEIECCKTEHLVEHLAEIGCCKGEHSEYLVEHLAESECCKVSEDMSHQISGSLVLRVMLYLISLFDSNPPSLPHCHTSPYFHFPFVVSWRAEVLADVEAIVGIARFESRILYAEVRIFHPFGCILHGFLVCL